MDSEYMLRSPLALLATLLLFAIGPAFAASTFEVVYAFPSPTSDSLTQESEPNSVAQAADGTLYGTTAYGGDQLAGTAFKISPTGTLTPLYSFTGPGPQGPLQAKPGGGFYGVTSQTGTSPASSLFTMDDAGTVTTVISASPDSDVAIPSPLVLGADGNYYGVLNYDLPGSIVKITPDGTVSTAHAFVPSGTEGYYPNTLIAGADGLLYGTTAVGGESNAGTIFSLTTGGTFQTLVSFNGDKVNDSTDYSYAPGGYPTGLTRAADGTLYAVTNMGSIRDYINGTIFRFSAGKLSILRGFGQGDDVAPFSLTVGDDDAIYGLMVAGGAFRSGALCRIAANGEYEVLHHFDQASGIYPYQLVRGVDGNLYGTTIAGGPANGGTVFRVRIGSGPTPFESWLTSNNLISGANGDDDHDGLSNLLEYATGTDPQVADAALAGEQGGIVISHGGLAMRYSADPSTGQNVAIFARRKNYDASNLTYAVQYSDNLTTWISLLAIPTVIASDTDMEIVSVNLLHDTSAKQYYRLQVLAP